MKAPRDQEDAMIALLSWEYQFSPYRSFSRVPAQSLGWCLVAWRTLSGQEGVKQLGREPSGKEPNNVQGAEQVGGRRYGRRAQCSQEGTGQ